MNILGYSYGSDNHDTSAAILCDGVLVAAAEEERFSRVKHDERFPLSAIELCLKRAQLSMDEIDLIALPCKPFRTGRQSELADLDADTFRQIRAADNTSWRRRCHNLLLDTYIQIGEPWKFPWQRHNTPREGLALLRRHFGSVPEVRFYGHHQAHAAATYYTSGWDTATIVTMDEVGGPFSTVIWQGEGTRIRQLGAELHTNSLGKFYTDCTKFLGFSDYEEGKTMGLAAYGDPSRFAERVSQLLDAKQACGYRYLRPPSREVLGFSPRTDEDPLRPPYPDFAAAVQSTFECAVRQVASRAMRASGTRNLCLGGGAMLNCSSNAGLKKANLTTDIWIFPGASDCGLSVGAAMLAAAEVQDWRPARLPHAYLGPDFGESECEMALRQQAGITYHRTGDVEAEVARQLASGKTVGWFQGRMEFGPRGLGNRSILADPRDATMHRRVNQLKGREAWRPLAPVVMAERSSEYFNPDGASPFMLFRATVHPDVQAKVPSIVHTDGSARPQTVAHDQNPRLYKLIANFAQITSVPMLLNTSFNAAGEPIVCTPSDAIRTFKRMGLDLLVLGDFIVTRAAG